MTSPHHRWAALAAGLTTLALAVTGCGGSGAPSGGSGPEKVELTVTTFGTMGFDKLYASYEAAHPGVTVKATNIDTGDNALVDWKTKQAAGSGLPDVQAVEEGWLGQVMKVSSSFIVLASAAASELVVSGIMVKAPTTASGWSNLARRVINQFLAWDLAYLSSGWP